MYKELRILVLEEFCKIGNQGRFVRYVVQYKLMCICDEKREEDGSFAYTFCTGNVLELQCRG